MMKKDSRLRDERGIAWVVVLMIVLVAVMLVIIALPSWEVFRFRSEKTACVQAMKSAEDGRGGPISVPPAAPCTWCRTNGASIIRCAACMTTTRSCGCG